QQSRQTNLQVGKALYEANCAGCHGMDRKAGQTNPALKTYPALAGPGVHLDEAGVRSLIATGQGTMPAFSQLTPAQRTAIASYVLDLRDKQQELFVNAPPANLPEYYRIPYREGGFKFLTKEGYPGVKP